MTLGEVLGSPSTTDESNLQDIEGFNFFKHMKSGIGPPLDPEREAVRMEEGEDLLPPTQFAEDSISSMDIDLTALDNVSSDFAVCLFFY